MDKVYKIRLKGTDLFYQPIKGRWAREKSNLSERGKIYDRKPKLKDYAGRWNISESRHKKYGIGHLGDESYQRGAYFVSAHEDAIEIVTFNVVEQRP